MSHDVKVLIRDCEDNPLLIWETLKMSFIQQWTAPHFNAYHALLSVEKSDSEPLDSLINRVDEQIRVIKSLSPSSFTLDNLYDDILLGPVPPPLGLGLSHLMTLLCLFCYFLMLRRRLSSNFVAERRATTPFLI